MPASPRSQPRVQPDVPDRPAVTPHPRQPNRWLLLGSLLAVIAWLVFLLVVAVGWL